MNFEEKVRSLSFKQILGYLIEGLENPDYEIDMHQFAKVNKKICYVCAATSAISKMGNVIFPIEKIEYSEFRSDLLNCSISFFWDFETALDKLREGDLINYNLMADELNFSKAPFYDKLLPKLDTHNYKRNLKAYKKFFKILK